MGLETTRDRHDGGWWARPLRRPRPLRMGDRMAIVSPCWGGPATFPERYRAGLHVLRNRFGFEIVEMPHALRDADWLDQNPKARADDLMAAFADPTIDGILASIGGDDAIRLIPHIDLAIIRDNPKPFIGYSDPTVIHFACLKAGVASFHGPTVMSGFAENGGMSEPAARSFEAAVMSEGRLGVLPTSAIGWTAEYLPWEEPALQDRPRHRAAPDVPDLLQGRGTVTGPLIGGCAEVLEVLKGTPLWPPASYWNGAILFYETSEEAPSAGYVLRWMRNFGAQGILHRLAGILLARPGGAMDADARDRQKLAVKRALHDAQLSDIPVLADLDIGHTDPILTLPYGATAEIDCEKRTVCVC